MAMFLEDPNNIVQVVVTPVELLIGLDVVTNQLHDRADSIVLETWFLTGQTLHMHS